MNLHEQMQNDLAVFLNPDEFGESLTIDGIVTVGVWDDVVQTAPDFHGADMDTWGVNTVERLLFVPENDVSCPTSGQQMAINGIHWLVQNARSEHGMLKLTLYRNED